MGLTTISIGSYPRVFKTLSMKGCLKTALQLMAWLSK